MGQPTLPPMEDKLDAIRAYMRIITDCARERKAANDAFNANLKKYVNAKNDQEREKAQAACEANLAEAELKHRMQADFLNDLQKALSEAKPLIEERKTWIKDTKEKWKGTLKMAKDHNDFVKEFKKSPSGKSSKLKPVDPPVKKVDKMFTDQEKRVADGDARISGVEKGLPKMFQLHAQAAGALQIQKDKFKAMTTQIPTVPAGSR